MGEQIIFIEQAIAVFSTYTHTHVHKMNIVFQLFLLGLLNCLFLNICCCHIPFVYVLVEMKPENNSRKLWKVLSPPHTLE